MLSTSHLVSLENAFPILSFVTEDQLSHNIAIAPAAKSITGEHDVLLGKGWLIYNLDVRCFLIQLSIRHHLNFLLHEVLNPSSFMDMDSVTVSGIEQLPPLLHVKGQHGVTPDHFRSIF